ncbi:MAG TPA: HAD-IA family hydrolase [Cellulomonas sp.]
MDSPALSPAASSVPDRPAAVLDGLDAVLFDLDGVLTPTAVVHMHAWAQLFTPVLEQHGAAPYTDADYFAHIDGKPRYDGVATLLASRGIELPWGEPTDSPDAGTVCGLGNRKNAVFTHVLATEGVTPYPGSVRLVDALIADGRKVAVVSSSRNAVPVLAAAGLTDRFGLVVDGLVAAARGLAGKPDPATYLYAAEHLGVPRERAVVVEDAESGVASGRAGAFGLVVGVDRGAGAAVLLDQGADLVVDDLIELVTAGPTTSDDRESTQP